MQGLVDVILYENMQDQQEIGKIKSNDFSSKAYHYVSSGNLFKRCHGGEWNVRPFVVDSNNRRLCYSKSEHHLQQTGEVGDRSSDSTQVSTSLIKGSARVDVTQFNSYKTIPLWRSTLHYVDSSFSQFDYTTHDHIFALSFGVRDAGILRPKTVYLATADSQSYYQWLSALKTHCENWQVSKESGGKLKLILQNTSGLSESPYYLVVEADGVVIARTSIQKGPIAYWNTTLSFNEIPPSYSAFDIRLYKRSGDSSDAKSALSKPKAKVAVPIEKESRGNQMIVAFELNYGQTSEKFLNYQMSHSEIPFFLLDSLRITLLSSDEIIPQVLKTVPYHQRHVVIEEMLRIFGSAGESITLALQLLDSVINNLSIESSVSDLFTPSVGVVLSALFKIHIENNLWQRFEHALLHYVQISKTLEIDPTRLGSDIKDRYYNMANLADALTDLFCNTITRVELYPQVARLFLSHIRTRLGKIWTESSLKTTQAIGRIVFKFFISGVLSRTLSLNDHIHPALVSSRGQRRLELADVIFSALGEFRNFENQPECYSEDLSAANPWLRKNRELCERFIHNVSVYFPQLMNEDVQSNEMDLSFSLCKLKDILINRYQLRLLQNLAQDALVRKDGSRDLFNALGRCFEAFLKEDSEQHAKA